MENINITMNGVCETKRVELSTALFNCRIIDTPDWLNYKVTPTNIVFYTKTNTSIDNRIAEMQIDYLDGDTQMIYINQLPLFEEYIFNVSADKSTIEWEGGTVTVSIEAIGMKTPYIAYCDTGEVIWSQDYSTCTFNFPSSTSEKTHHLIFVGHTNSNMDIVKEILVQQNKKIITYTYYTYVGNENISGISNMDTQTTTGLPHSQVLDGYGKKCIAIAIPSNMTLTHFSDMFGENIDLFTNSNYPDFTVTTSENYKIYKYYSNLGNVDNTFTATFS